MLQAVIVEDMFAPCAFAVYPPVFFGIPWDAGREVEVIVILYVDGVSIVFRGTFFCMGQEFMRSHFSRQRYLGASFMGALPHGHILCLAGQRGCLVLLKVMSVGHFQKILPCR